MKKLESPRASRAIWTCSSSKAIGPQMNPETEISIREVSLFDALEKSPAFCFTGTRGELAAYLIEKDSAHWNCPHYFICDRGPAGDSDRATRHWYVWRR
jgi:hypothetical protein